MDHIQIQDEIMQLVCRLNDAQKVLYRQAKSKAETERIYRMQLSKEIFRLRSDGYPVALIGDLARGSIGDEKFERDLAESQFKATIEVIQVLKTQISALQSIYRVSNET